MDQMLPSPGFPPLDSIPSVGTPLHHPEEDQQILPMTSPMHSRSQANSSAFGLTLPHQQSNTAASSQPLYSMPGFTPQHMLQPQTPVNQAESSPSNCQVSIIIMLLLLASAHVAGHQPRIQRDVGRFSRAFAGHAGSYGNVWALHSCPDDSTDASISRSRDCPAITVSCCRCSIDQRDIGLELGLSLPGISFRQSILAASWI